jgi:hypothetical protein
MRNCSNSGEVAINRLTNLDYRIKSALHKAESIAISSDICTQKGMAHSFIAFTAHFFSTEHNSLQRCLLDVVELDAGVKHSAQLIKLKCKEVLAKYDINEYRVFVYIKRTVRAETQVVV